MKMARLIKIGEASKLIGVCCGTLRRWDKERYFVPDKISKGKRRYYSLEKVQSFLDCKDYKKPL
jgi:DNA-binding transcriptional MerR regulator